MIKEKKAGVSILVTVIVILAVFLLLGVFTNTFGATVVKGSDIDICRVSVLAQAQTKTFGQTHTSLKCSRRQVKFFNNKVEINGKKEPKYKFDELDDEVVNKVIAEELRICWGMMGEGEIDVFRQPIITLTNIELGQGVCTICSEVSFDKSVDRNKEFTGLLNYLKGTKKPPEKKIYYYDYLVRAQRDLHARTGLPLIQYTPWGWGTTSKIEEDSFQTGKDYVVYFEGFKSDKVDDVTGIAPSVYYIGLGTPGKAAKQCVRLVN